MRALLLSLLLAAPVAAQSGWRTVVTGESSGRAVEFTSVNAALRLREGETLHPEISGHNFIVEYEALLVLFETGVQRFTLEIEGGVGILELIDPADPERRVSIDITEERGAPLALPNSDLPEVLVRVRFERSGSQAARLRVLREARLADGSWYDFEPIPAWAVRQPPDNNTAAGDQAFLGRVLLEAKGCTSCHEPGAQGTHAVGESRSPEEYKALVAASWLWKNPAPLEADDLRWVEDSEQLNTSPPLTTLIAGRGCMDPEDTNTPRYSGLSALDRAALAAGIESVKNAVGDHAPMDAGRRRFELLGCTNCHTANSDTHVSLGRELGEHGLQAPNLGDAGWRLKEMWITDVLTGRAKAHRPDLAHKGRMPSFPADLVAPLTTYLSASAGVPTGEAHVQKDDIAELASAGRDLAGTDRMGCVSCHYLGERVPTTLGPFDLARFPERLRREWFDAFVISPARLQRGATMPGLNNGGESSVHDVLGGDLARQAEALWAWCENAHELADPVGTQKPERGVIGDKPAVLEAAFDGRELRCVGTPSGLHFGWDAEIGHLTEAWVNPFITPKPDGTDDRGAVIWRAPSGPSLWVGSKPKEWPETTREGSYEFSRDEHGDWGASHHIGALAVHETASGMTVPETVVVRSIQLSGVSTNERYWFRPGPGELNIESVKMCDARKHPAPAGEAPWIELLPHPGRSECSLRVALRP